LLLAMSDGGSSIVLDCSCSPSSVVMGMHPLDPAEMIGLARAPEAADGLVLKLGGTFVVGPMGAVEGGEDCGEGVGLVESVCWLKLLALDTLPVDTGGWMVGSVGSCLKLLVLETLPPVVPGWRSLAGKLLSNLKLLFLETFPAVAGGSSEEGCGLEGGGRLGDLELVFLDNFTEGETAASKVAVGPVTTDSFLVGPTSWLTAEVLGLVDAGWMDFGIDIGWLGLGLGVVTVRTGLDCWAGPGRDLLCWADWVPGEVEELDVFCSGEEVFLVAL
jgi:hypothetical protein